MSHVYEHGQHQLPFWRQYIFSTDHKIIGLQYGITALFFCGCFFCMVLMMRWNGRFRRLLGTVILSIR